MKKIASLQKLINFVIVLFQVSHMHLSKCIMKKSFFNNIVIRVRKKIVLLNLLE